MQRAKPMATGVSRVLALPSPWLDPIPSAQCCHCASLPPNEAPYLFFYCFLVAWLELLRIYEAQGIPIKASVLRYVDGFVSNRAEFRRRPQ
jgi:hypothetical protein